MPPSAHGDFELTASPPHWFEIAKDLRDQAHALHGMSIGRTLYTSHTGASTLRERTNRGVFLLAGFSIENILKSYLIFEDPSLVANGMLSKRIRTHRLSALRDMSRLVPYKNRYAAVLAAMEDGLESWARYPCGLTHTGSTYERVVTPELWLAYNSMFNAYQKRLESLLTKVWRAPSGGEYRMRYE